MRFSAGEWSRPWNHVARRYRPVQLKLDTRIRPLVGAWKADRRRRSTASTRNIDLCTLHVQLRTRIAGRSMQRDDLRTEQIIPILDALGQRELDFPFVVVQACYSPGAVRIQSVFPDLEPLETRDGCCQRTVYLG